MATLDVPELLGGLTLTGYSDAVAIGPTEKPNVFTVDLKRDWCIGIAPQGGYLMSILCRATQVYFQTHQQKLNQPDLITSHATYLARSVVGPAIITITPLKLGRQYSTVRVQLSQSSLPSSHTAAICIEAHLTQGNLVSERLSGSLTLTTPPMIPMSSIPSLPSCEERRDPPALWTLRPANAKLIMKVAPETNALMAHPVLGASVREQWVRWRDSSDAEKGFDVSGLCFLVGTFRPLVEAYGEEGYWFPTMSCSVEVKKGPPKGEKGWEWLFMRIESHQIRYGRMDIERIPTIQLPRVFNRPCCSPWL